MSTQELTSILKTITEQAWHSRSMPILLSNVPIEFERLNPEQPNIKELLAGKSLKQFVKETEHKFGYKLAEHPSQKAKIGLIPDNVEYNFPTPNQKDSIDNEDDDLANRKAGHALIKALEKLSSDDLDKISIPASIVIKLFK